MGRGVKVNWQESSEELKHRYLKEVHPQRRTRLQALWQLQQGKRVQDVVNLTGASYRSVEQWQVVSRRWTWRSPETGGRAPGPGQKALSKPAAAKGPGGQGATGPVPNGLGCSGMGPGSLGGELHL